MTSRDFCYGLQGFFFEIAEPIELDYIEITEIRNHLNMVFIQEIDLSFPESQQSDLNAAHSGEYVRLNMVYKDFSIWLEGVRDIVR